MPKIIDYEIITDTDPDRLSTDLNMMIETGWQPFGGLAMSQSETVDTERVVQYAQALVKYEEAPK